MLSILLLITSFLQPAQSIPDQFEWISTESGLSNNIVYSTYQDSEGFIWIGTDNGLNRYDGYDFKTFYHDSDDSTSISSNVVRNILEDKAGNLWIGTVNGLNLFDRETESFVHFFELPDLPTKRLDMQIMQLDDGGRLWFHTLRTAGWFDISKREFSFIDSELDVFSLAIDEENRVWIASKSGEMFEVDPDSNELRVSKDGFVQPFTAIHRGRYSGNLWARFNFEIGDGQSKIPSLPGRAAPLDLLETAPGVLWIGTNQGLYIYSEATNRIDKVDFGERTSSLTESIRNVYQDKNGGVWVGTLNGLFYFDSYQKPFYHMDLIDGIDDVVMGIESIGDEIWMNTFADNIYAYNSTTHSLRIIEIPGRRSNEFYQIWDLHYVPDTKYPVWFVSNEGLHMYNPRRGALKKVRLEAKREPHAITFSITEADANHLWVTNLRSAYKLSKHDGSVLERVDFFDDINQSSIQEIYQYDEKVFIATESEGLVVYALGGRDSIELKFENSSKDEFSVLPIWDLLASGNEVLWVGTNRGLYKVNTESLSITHIDIEQELANRIIFSIAEDSDGSLWLGTEKGLVLYNPSNEHVTYYYESDGVKNVEFNRRSVTKTTDGRLWLGGVNGVTFFNPSEIRPNPVIPPVHITRMDVVTLDSTFTPPGFHQKEVKLKWFQNTVEFEFAALNYSNAEKNQYRYQLVGQDQAWVENKQTRSARYVQLPHGEYTFRVQGSNNDGVWNTEGVALKLLIYPPFWKTWWFRALILAAIVLILWGLYTYRVRKLLEVERIRLRIASDLHDEVGSGLSGIALTGDLLQRQANNGGVKPELINRVTQNARNLASSLDAIVWLIDPKKETMEDFLIKCRTVANELLQNTTVEIIEEVPDASQKKVLSSVQRRNLFLLFKEAIHNIAKHADADEVGISFMMQEEQFMMYLNDNGRGFKINGSSPGHGLDSMANRAKELDAHFSVHSDVGLGTHIELKVKLP